jgi:hypothetical protein
MHEGAIRHALRTELERTHPDRADTLIREELGLCLGRTRVDVAMVNGLMSGFEIKSPRDTLDRLPTQVRLYNQVLDRATIVTAPGYLGAVRGLISPWWGIWVAKDVAGIAVLHQVRTAKPNPSRDALSVAQLLWRDEVAAILRADGHRVGSSATRWTLWDQLVLVNPLSDLLAKVRGALKSRTDWPGGG